MKILTCVVAAIWIFTFWSLAAMGATITVMLDGTGDFESIQPALDSAAAGDTLIIGAGEFQESNIFDVPGAGPEGDVYGYVPVSELTIIGAGSDLTIVGPPEPEGNLPGFNPKGFAWVGGTSLRISNLSVRNCYEGVYAVFGPLEISNCNFVNNSNGVNWAAHGSSFRALNINCISNLPGTPNGISCSGSNNSGWVEDCSFEGASLRVSNSGNYYIRRCSVRDLIVGMSIGGATYCLIEECNIWDCVNYGLSIFGYSEQVEVVDSEISGQGAAVTVGGDSHLVATQTIFNGGYWATIYFNNAESSTVSDCHIFPGTGPLIRSFRHSSFSEVVHDFRNNYWGTDDGNEIQSLIWDGSEDSENATIVLFEPFAGGPVSTQKTSIDRLKAMYR